MKKIIIAGLLGTTFLTAPSAFSGAFSGQTFSTISLVGQSSVLTVDKSRGVLTMAPLVKRVSPSVVSIRTEGVEAVDPEMNEMMERFFGQRLPERRSGGLGSGVIVDAAKGYILTNNHVVADADEIWVTLSDKRELQAKLVGRDEKTDIAVIQIKSGNLRSMDFAPDDDTEVGDYVIAIGNPFGLEHTVTTGIVSGLGRSLNRGDTYEDFIQTDASINPGNSGGALINSKGELIGINSAILSRSGGNNGIGFAVPVKMARNVMNQLINHGEVRRGKIGVSIRNIDPALKEAMDLSTLEGALVNDVTDGGSADKAGIKDGDVIVKFNGSDIQDADDIRNAVGLVEPGKSVDLTYLRGDKRYTTRVVVEASDDDSTTTKNSAMADNPALEGFSGASLVNIPKELELRGGNKGVYVAQVRPGSKAARSGMRKGDVIRKVGKEPVKNVSEFENLVKDKDGPIALSVERDGTNIFIAVR